MILEELSSNLPSFHAIRFKKGLNFIIGKKRLKVMKKEVTMVLANHL